jgi:hypothetical protein
MSAIKQLQSQAKQNTFTPVVDLSIRHLLAKALTDSGKFEAVNSKADTRRGSLSVKLRGSRMVRNAETIEALARKAGLTVKARLTSSDLAEAGFKIEQLQITSDVKAPASTTVQTNQLVAGLTKSAPVYNGSISVTVAGVSCGYVSQEAATKIKALIAEDQKPKIQTVTMVDLNTNAPVHVMMPNAVAEAIKGKVPSFNSGEWSVKSSSSIVIVRHTKTGGHWVVI